MYPLPRDMPTQETLAAFNTAWARELAEVSACM